MDRFTSEKEYLECLAECVDIVSDNNRASFCRNNRINESALSFFLNRKKRMGGVEQKVLKASGAKKQVQTEILLDN